MALGELDRTGVLGDRADAILADAEHLPPPGDLVLAHGDLHLRHALVDDTGALTGVIDWGDICRAPASIDLSLYWSAFPRPARERFTAAYGDVDDATLLRARVLALFLNATLAVYARTERMPALEAEARSGVERALID